MGGYLVNFSVYTMAMIGLIFFALMVYKKFAQGSISGKKSEFLNVEETLSLSPRKTLYVVRAGGEKFLIAGDVDKTSLISKLEDNVTSLTSAHRSVTTLPDTDFEVPSSSIDDLPVISATSRKNKNVLQDMVRKISN